MLWNLPDENASQHIASQKNFETELNYSEKYEWLEEAALDTHTCDEDPDLVEAWGPAWDTESGNRAPTNSGQVLVILH